MSLEKSRPDRDARGDFHVPPVWVEQDALFFITINCANRGIPQLTSENIACELFESISFYKNSNRWWPEIVLLMPDHMHALIRFSWSPKNGMNEVISAWKRYTARKNGINWQRDFFDHRIRGEQDHNDKWHYIQQNPVRKGLVGNFADWPYVWRPHQIGWG